MPVGDAAVLKGKLGAGYVGGYSVIQADSLDAAKRVMDGHPHFGAPDASIEIFEQLAMPGM